jgi:hypothetical protein
MKRFAAALAVALGLAAVPADASVSIAVQFDELVTRSKAVAALVPVEQRSVWEGKFIITYTRMHVDDAIAGDVENGKDVWVASRGGSIGDIGQSVDGEPVFHVGYPVVAFLREDIMDDKSVPASGVFVVTGRAQGTFPIMMAELDKRKKLVSSVHVGLLLPPQAKIPIAPKALAREVLEDKPLDEARATIAAAWKRLHEQKR